MVMSKRKPRKIKKRKRACPHGKPLNKDRIAPKCAICKISSWGPDIVEGF
jgi:hypothetical protein